MKLSQNDVSLIKKTWGKEFDKTSKYGVYLYQLNAPCLTGVFFKIDKSVSQYEIWVETRSLHRENSGLVQRRFNASFGALGSREAILSEIRASTLLKDGVTLFDAINVFDYMALKQRYIEPWAAEASAIIRFLKYGAQTASDFVNQKQTDWLQWPNHIQVKYNMSFDNWVQHVRSYFDIETIKTSVASELKRENIQLTDNAFTDFSM